MDLSVLHVVQPTEGGAPRCAADLAIDQARRGWTVAVASPAEHPLLGWLQSEGIQHLAWPARRDPLSALREVRPLARMISSLRPSLLHLHSAKAGLVGRLCVRGGTPTVYQPHAWSFHAVSGPVGAATLMWERRAARWTDAVLCVSSGEAAQGRAAGIEAMLEVIPNGVDLSKWPFAGDARRAAARERLGLSDGPLVVCVGRITEQKGQDVLLSAWPRVVQEVPDAELVLIGDGPRRAEWAKAAPPSVTFAGQRSDAVDWLAASDVVAIPSRWEGMALAMLEALATGRSVVSTDVDGAADALRDGVGAIVPREEVGQLADALIERLKDRALRTAEGVAARRVVEAGFDLHMTFNRTAALYEKVLKNRDL